MTVYVTGDVHGRAEYGSSRFAFKNWPLGRTLTRDDVVIVAGDFGFVWDGSNAEKYWLDWFESKPWTTCFVDGNHENHHALAGLPVREWNGGFVHEARPHVLHLMRGEVFDIDGLTVLAMGGVGVLAGSTSLHRGGFGSAHDDALDPLDRLIEDGRCVERSLHAGSGVRVVAVDQAGDGIGLREAKARADVLYGVTGLR